MPYTEVYYKPHAISEHALLGLSSFLPGIVAAALDVSSSEPDGGLKASDIEVRFKERHYLDANTPVLGITIFANQYEARLENRDERRAKIADEVRKLVPEDIVGKGNGFVWFLQMPGSFEML